MISFDTEKIKKSIDYGGLFTKVFYSKVSANIGQSFLPAEVTVKAKWNNRGTKVALKVLLNNSTINRVDIKEFINI